MVKTKIYQEQNNYIQTLRLLLGHGANVVEAFFYWQWESLKRISLYNTKTEFLCCIEQEKNTLRCQQPWLELYRFTMFYFII